MRAQSAPRSFLLVAALIGVSAASSFPSELVRVEKTPYDGQMLRIRSVLTAAASSADHTSLATVNGWMSDLRCIPYGFQQVWKTPDEVASRRPADCKAKAVALYSRMQASGATNLRLVIGKRAPTSRQTHAWLEWETASGTYMLDPTFNYAATRIQDIRTGCYVALYEYAGTKKFRAASTLVAQN
jgi:predicted transglutaminase-like cysteine proteinase